MALDNATSKNNLEWALSFDEKSDEDLSQETENAYSETGVSLPELV